MLEVEPVVVVVVPEVVVPVELAVAADGVIDIIPVQSEFTV